MSLSVGYPYEEWQEHDIYLSEYEDECGEWWNRLTRAEKFSFFPWATGSCFKETSVMIREEEYKIDFIELDEDIQEQIVEKYAVQKGLVTPVEELPDWKTRPFYNEKIKELLLK